MYRIILPILTFYLSTVPGFLANSKTDYCVIGAGPGGLQMGYFLERAGRDYVIFERANTSGAFFVKYPRHRKLISINKRHTGKTNKEFNLRHDWNSLISDDDSLLMRHYSKEFFPQTDDYIRYLNDYAKKLDLNIQYNTNIRNIKRVPDQMRENMTDHFTMQDQNGNSYACRYLIVCTGIATPNTPSFFGSQYTESYEDVSIDPDDFEGQSVLILGRGNSAFETADNIVGATNLIHLVARSRIRLAWATHYVGDLRAINNGLLDTYMLKSLDGLLEGDVSDMYIFKRPDGKLILGLPEDQESLEELRKKVKEGVVDKIDVTELYDTNDNTLGTLDFGVPDNFALREPYDRIIRCLGFKFDFEIFSNETNVKPAHGRKKKYPEIRPNHESSTVPGLFFAGTNTHSLDFRKSAGGFIHGFRYTTRALHRILEWRNHRVPWPSTQQPIADLLNHIIKRINEASGTYQMFGVLGDVIILKENGTEYIYLEEFPLKLVHRIGQVAGIHADSIMVVSLEYGHDFSGPGNDVFKSNRAIGEPSEAHLSNFLHPVIYYYEKLPTLEDMHAIKRNPKLLIPEPTKLHHIVEDFLTDFSAPVSHMLVLRRFLEECVKQDLRYYFDNDCFWMALSNSNPPESCKKQYLEGQGLPSYVELEDALSRYREGGEDEDDARMQVELPGDEMQGGGREWGMGVEL